MTAKPGLKPKIQISKVRHSIIKIIYLKYLFIGLKFIALKNLNLMELCSIPFPAQTYLNLLLSMRNVYKLNLAFMFADKEKRYSKIYNFNFFVENWS